MLAGVGLALLAGLGFLSSAIADTTCSATVPCEIGCCGQYGVCGMGPSYCASDVCINNCDAKAECNPGSWASEYVNSTNCPLDVCCSKYGFCGTTEEFCGNKTVSVPSCDASSQSITRVIGYYNSAAATRSCGGMAPYSVPQGVYSHIYFAFGNINPDTFEVIPMEPSDEALYTQLAALQLRDLDQELWISIGGWDFSDSDQATATTFSDLVAATTTEQNVFFTSLINFMSTYGFVGVDIDWEYPVASDRNGRAADYKNYPTFLANLKKALSDYKYGLSITLPTSYWYLQHFDLTAIEPSVDWFNVMTYDLHGTWDLKDIWTGPYLDAHSNLTEIKSALDLLWGVNITASKVNLGMAFYGRSFTIESSSCSTPGCEYLSAGTAGNCSQSAGVLFNSEIEALISDQDLTPILYQDAAVKTITWNTDQWVSFDDEETMKLKAEYAKSVCLGGVMVWSIDEDDDSHTYSNALAAALGNKVNLNTSTGLSLTVSEKSTTTSSGSSQSSYCRFINCGETCPSGFSEITREDNKKQLMLDATECLVSGLQTLCCPTSSTLPTCQWRGFNGGKCKGGCDDGEAEVGTITSGCRSGYQSACCTITDSTKPWSECAWTSSCEPDDTCPSYYDKFVVGSRQGWGGRKTCTGSKTYNYCCKSSIPNAFTNCAWTGHEVQFVNTAYCTDACPSGSIRIAEESVAVFMGANRPGKTKGSQPCYFGNEAYCCNGTTSTSSTRLSSTKFADETAYEFHYYLNAWLSEPTCSSAEQHEYYSSLYKRNVFERSSSFSKSMSQDLVYAYALKYLVIWITSSRPRADLTADFNSLMSTYGYEDEAANITTLTDTLYAYGSWTGTPVWDPTALLAQTLCNIARSANGVESLGAASELLCEIQSSSSISKRMLDGLSENTHSENGDQPTVITAIRGVINEDLTFHYARWIQPTSESQGFAQVILELAFWIGPTPGVTPTAEMLETYGDSGDTVHPDLWIVFHLHIPRSRETFHQNYTVTGGMALGVSAMGVYHSQTMHSLGRNADPRAEFRYSSTYPSYNSGDMENYNGRTQSLRCPDSSRWYIGLDSTEHLTTSQGLPLTYATELNEFGMWLATEGILTNVNLQYLWPGLSRFPQDASLASNEWTMVPPSGSSLFNPVADAFNVNWGPDDTTVDIQGSTSDYTKK